MYFEPTSKIAIAALLAISLTGISYASQEPILPQSEIVLTVSEQETLGNRQGGSAAFSIDMLRALPQETFETSTIWTQGIRKFKGVPLSELLDHVETNDEADPANILATAANDYSVIIPFPKQGDLYPIVAYEMDDALMTLRGKGPLWIVYPFDADKEYQTETVYSRSIWQLEKIELSR